METMGTIEIVSGIILIVSCIILIAAVLLQEAKTSGLSGSVGGGEDSYLGGGRGRTNAQKLMGVTKVLTALVFIITLVVSAISVWM